MTALLLSLMVASAPAKWTKTDTMYELSFALITFTDVMQTHYISSSYPRFYEKNPIIGEHPSHAAVNAIGLVGIAGHALIASQLRQPYRRIWQVFWIGVEANNVFMNWRGGIGLQFRW